MSLTNPANTTAGDIVLSALKECGAIGVGQIPLAEDSIDALARLNWMISEWRTKRFLIYHLVDIAFVSTGATSYTVGPLQQFNTGTGSVRPNRLENGCFQRQITMPSPNQIDYPLQLLESREDYNRIALKNLSSFAGYVFYDPGWPVGQLYPWPLPQANIYEIHILVREQLPTFTTTAQVFNIPYEYYWALVTNLALRLRAKYQISAFPGDTLAAQAKASLANIRGANTALARLKMPSDMQRPGIYNIFSDQMY